MRCNRIFCTLPNGLLRSCSIHLVPRVMLFDSRLSTGAITIHPEPAEIITKPIQL
jgi:hypothetical protein